jgi:hypothetical protein
MLDDLRCFLLLDEVDVFDKLEDTFEIEDLQD